MPSILYILTNEAMPDCVKIGITDNVERRMKELYGSTAVPLPFDCYYAAEVENADIAEKKIHFALGDFRMNDKREFFRIAPEKVRAILELIATKDATPKGDNYESDEERHAVADAKKRRPAFSFKMVGIQPGSTLTFTEDPSITCEVNDDRSVLFRGETTSLSASAMTVLREKGFNGSAYAGTDYWEYKGEKLWNIRNRLEGVGENEG
jgi:hypothetical protein